MLASIFRHRYLLLQPPPSFFLPFFNVVFEVFSIVMNFNFDISLLHKMCIERAFESVGANCQYVHFSLR